MNGDSKLQASASAPPLPGPRQRRRGADDRRVCFALAHGLRYLSSFLSSVAPQVAYISLLTPILYTFPPPHHT